MNIQTQHSLTNSLYRLPLFLLLFCFVLLPGCGGDSNSSTPPPPKDTGPSAYTLIAKSWKLKRLSMKNNAPVPPSVMTTSSFNFSSDGRYEILMGSLERGNWSLSADAKILITVDDSTRQEKHIDIEKLESDFLILYNNTGENPLRMELVPDI